MGLTQTVNLESYGKSPLLKGTSSTRMINGYKWSIFHSYVSYYQRVNPEQIRGLHVCLDTWLSGQALTECLWH